jgi:hypothetical protein
MSESTARRDCLLIRLRWSRAAAMQREDLLEQFGKAVLRLDGLFKRTVALADRAALNPDGGPEVLDAIATALKVEHERLALFGLLPDGKPMRKIDPPKKRDGLPVPRGHVADLFPEDGGEDQTLSVLTEEEAALVQLPEDVGGG